MMAAVGARWVCLLCKEKALGDPMAKEREKYRVSSYVPNYTWLIVGLTVVAVLWRVGLAVFFDNASASARKPLLLPQPVAQAAASWAAKPPAEWPALVTEASADFKSPLFVAGRQACFVQDDDGAFLALTTVDLKNDADTKDGEVNPARLDSEIVEWRAGSGGQALKFTKVRPSGEDAFMAGLVVLALPEGAKAPVTPITVRKSVYRPGAPAFAVVRNAQGGQTVYRGHILDNDSADGSTDVTIMTYGRVRSITANGDGSATRVHFDEGLKVSDLIGAALVDSDGLLMAIITSPQAEVARDAKTKTFMAYGMKALSDTINHPPAPKRPLERAASEKK